MKRLILIAVTALAGCTNIFLQPDHVLRYLPERAEGAWQDVHFKSADGTDLIGLWFSARKTPSKGVIVHFHGNGENMSSHYLFVYWLAAEGYDVFTFDYRGYGGSAGKKSLTGSIEDGAAALRVARGRAGASRERLIVLGQSLGGALALASLDRDGGEGVRGVILDSTFASYRKVARFLANAVGKAHARQMDEDTRSKWAKELSRARTGDLKAPSWLWSSVVDLLAIHEKAYLEHCRLYALNEA